MPLAFAPFGLWALAPVGLALLFLAWVEAGPGRAAWRGWLWGLGQYSGVFWIHESFQFAHVALPLAVALTGALIAAFALYPAALGLLLTRRPRPPWVLLLVLAPAAWVVAEWVRAWLFTGFPWLQAGYAQTDGPLGALAPVAGVLGVSGAVALVAGALAHAALAPRRPWVGLGAVGLVLALGVALPRGGWTGPAGPPLAVALVQGNVPQDRKWLPAEREPTLAHYLEATAAHGDKDLVVWPETAVPAFLDTVPEYLERVRALADATDTAVVLGAPYRDPATERLHNTVAVLDPAPALYHKRHLVPFGEYVPLESTLGPLLDVMRLPLPGFAPGPGHQPALEAAGQPLGISVCYEVVFGEEVRRTLPAATVLVNVSNDAWFGASTGPHQHLQMARMRALETGRPLVRATNTGITAIIGPEGRVVARLPQFETAVLTGEVTPRSGLTPYARLGDLPVLSLALAAVLAVVGVPRRRGRGAPSP
jgi:apolipoprotein N-acyltransferase